MSKNFINKKSRYKMDSYTPLMVSLMVILLFTVAIICYHYAKHRSKGKTHCSTNKIKMENSELKILVFKILHVISAMP